MNSFSVVIPIYRIDYTNNFEYFRLLIDCISKNCLNKAIYNKLNEIVIVNDQSEKNFKEVIENLFRELNLLQKLKYIQNSNNFGQAQSRNIGFLNSTGEFIHFIDQDDFIDDNFYLKFLNATEDLLIGSPHLYLSSKKKEIDYIKNNYILKLSKAKKIYNLWLLLITNFAVSPGQYLVKRSIFELIKGFPVLNTRGSDDYGLIFRLAVNKASLKYANDAIFYYRIHEMQNRANSNLEKSVIEFLKQQINSQLSISLRLVKFIRCRILLWKAISKILFYYYYCNFKSNL